MANTNVVKGKNVIVEMNIAAVYYPVFCCKTMEFVQSQEIIEVTSINSGFSREYEAGMSTATLSVTGITVLDNTSGQVSITYLIQEAIRRQVQSMRITLTSDAANSLQISFDALITSNTLSRERGSYSQSNTGFVITGTPTISALVPPPAVTCLVFPLYIDCVATETSVHDAALEAAGIVILLVERTGIGHDVTTGVPGNREYKFGGVGVGTISFDTTNPFNAGETIYILYQT